VLKNNAFSFLAAVLILAACATTPGGSQIVVWETAEMTRPHEVIGPVSISEEIAEKGEDMIQGLAVFMSRDGRVSDKIPAEMKTALEIRKEKYKEMIFEKLGAKARKYGADAVIGTEYLYIPALVTLSSKATVTAKGTMIKYKR
jgi:uncharacterized protein YbjQ (UPF0145 family)